MTSPPVPGLVAEDDEAVPGRAELGWQGGPSASKERGGQGQDKSYEGDQEDQRSPGRESQRG